MAHWEHRDEPKWQKFKFRQPYEKGLKRLREEVLAKTDFDPATLWQWGTMQAMALIEVLKGAERTFGEEGQKMVFDALRRIGHDIGSQILADVTIDPDLTPGEFASFYCTVINRIVYASLEDPKIDSDKGASFHILWCPHQDHYSAFDCRVQRYFVQGMLEAAREKANTVGFDVRFDYTIPAGAETCHFSTWQADDASDTEWIKYTSQLEKKALERARRP